MDDSKSHEYSWYSNIVSEEEYEYSEYCPQKIPISFEVTQNREN
jgi:hypothetical protein